MDTLFSAILGELTSRFLSFLIHRCLSKPLPPQPPAMSKEEKIKRLERMLLRLTATAEEAEGRGITNHAMLRQDNMLRQDMHKGYYLLDTFRFQKSPEEKIMNEDNNERQPYNTCKFMDKCLCWAPNADMSSTSTPSPLIWQ